MLRTLRRQGIAPTARCSSATALPHERVGHPPTTLPIAWASLWTRSASWPKEREYPRLGSINAGLEGDMRPVLIASSPMSIIQFALSPESDRRRLALLPSSSGFGLKIPLRQTSVNVRPRSGWLSCPRASSRQVEVHIHLFRGPAMDCGSSSAKVPGGPGLA